MSSTHQEPARRTEISRHPSGWEIVRKIDQKDRKYIDKIIAPPEGLPPERKVFRAIRDAVEKGGMPPVGPDWVDVGENAEDEAEGEEDEEAIRDAEGHSRKIRDEEADVGAEGKEGSDDEAEEPGPAQKKPKLQDEVEVEAVEDGAGAKGKELGPVMKKPARQHGDVVLVEDGAGAGANESGLVRRRSARRPEVVIVDPLDKEA